MVFVANVLLSQTPTHPKLSSRLEQHRALSNNHPNTPNILASLRLVRKTIRVVRQLRLRVMESITNRPLLSVVFDLHPTSIL